MVIKSIEIAGFKNVHQSTPKKYDFFHDTIIQGENFQGKTSIGDALCWVFCGCSSTGITADYLLRNSDSSTAFVEVVFEDNNGKTHILSREQKRESGKSYKILLDQIPVRESDLSPYIMDHDIFMSTFMIGYFGRLGPKQARELLMQVLPFPSHQNIVNKVSADVRSYLPIEECFDSNSFLRQKKSDLKLVENEIRLWNDKLKQAEEQISSVPNEDHVDESQLKSRMDMLESRKENLIRASMQNNSVAILESKLSVLRLEMQSLSGRINNVSSNYEKTCPTCNQPIPEEERRRMEEKIKESNLLMQRKFEEAQVNEQELLAKINEAQEQSGESLAINQELEAVQSELNYVKSEYDKLIRHNEAIKIEKNLFDQAKKMLESAKERIENLSSERYQLNRSIVAASQYNSIKASLQYDTVRSSIKNVSIRFQKVVPSTDELRDCFEILYKGRELQQISTSEVIRAGLEISTLLNQRTGLKIPIFIDNAESITSYEKPHVQIFEARVLRDAPLTVKSNA